jgi:hypothetical protein
MRGGALYAGGAAAQGVCSMVLTPLRFAAGVDGGLLARPTDRRDFFGLRNSPNAHRLSCPIRKIERRSGFLQVDGGPFVRLGED